MNSLSEFISTVPSSSLLSSSRSAKACISAASVSISSGWSCEGGSFRSPNRISGWLPLQWSTTGPSWQTQAGQCHCVWVIIGILICLCSPHITNPVRHLGMPPLPVHWSTMKKLPQISKRHGHCDEDIEIFIITYSQERSWSFVVTCSAIWDITWFAKP